MTFLCSGLPGANSPQACFLGSALGSAAQHHEPPELLLPVRLQEASDPKGCAPCTEQGLPAPRDMPVLPWGPRSSGMRAAGSGIARQRPAVAVVYTGGAAEGTVALPLGPAGVGHRWAASRPCWAPVWVPAWVPLLATGGTRQSPRPAQNLEPLTQVAGCFMCSGPHLAEQRGWLLGPGTRGLQAGL